MLTWKTTAMAVFVRPDEEQGDGSFLAECVTVVERGAAVRLRSIIPKEAMAGGEPELLKAWADKHEHELIPLKSNSFAKRVAEVAALYPEMQMDMTASFIAERGLHHIISISKTTLVGKKWFVNVGRFDERGPEAIQDHAHQTVGVFDRFIDALNAAEAWRVKDDTSPKCECKEIDNAPQS